MKRRSARCPIRGLSTGRSIVALSTEIASSDGVGTRDHNAWVMKTLPSLPSSGNVTFSRAQALSAGYDDHEIASAVRAGRWIRVRRGAYAVAGVPATDSDPQRLHLLRARDVSSKFGDGVALSHQSAVLIHGLPVWGAPLANVQVTRIDDRATRIRAGVESQRCVLRPDELTLVGTVNVTTVERSLVDFARVAGFEAAVCSMDAALRASAVSSESLDRAARRMAGRAGVGDARRAVTFADGASESVGESRLRVAIHELGFPPPLLQQLFCDERARPVGRVDYWWPEANLIGEFDGLVKYRGSMGAPVDVLIAEKRREDRLRALTGATVIRVTYRELDDRHQLERSLGTAFAGSSRPIRGAVSPRGALFDPLHGVKQRWKG